MASIADVLWPGRPPATVRKTIQVYVGRFLGYAHHHVEHHTHAITCYQHALDLLRDLGDRYYEADTLTRLGDTHHATDNPDAARTAWQHALTILDQLGHPDADQLRTKLAALDQITPTAGLGGVVLAQLANVVWIHRRGGSSGTVIDRPR